LSCLIFFLFFFFIVPSPPAIYTLSLHDALPISLVAADTVLSRIANRGGTLGLLVADSALYRETTLTMIQLRQLLSDIQANPRKRSEEHTSELQSRSDLVCRLLLEKKKKKIRHTR